MLFNYVSVYVKKVISQQLQEMQPSLIQPAEKDKCYVGGERETHTERWRERERGSG